MIDNLIPLLYIQLFADPNTQVTTQDSLSVENKIFYSDYLIDFASPKLVHDQFAQKHPIPKNGGKKIEFRKYSPLGKMLTPLTEGVTPDGQSLSVSAIEVAIRQYGGYVTLSDILDLTAIDDNVMQATKLIGDQSGATLDTITREVLNGGTSVQYAAGQVTSREALTPDHKLTVDCIRRAVRFLKTMNAPRQSDNNYVAIIHPDISYDLMSDPAWQAPHEYKDTEELYAGEIGRIAGTRFVETTEAKVFHADNLNGTTRNLTMGSTSVAAGTAADTSITIAETLATGMYGDNSPLIGREIIIADAKYTISAVPTATTIKLKEAVAGVTVDGTNYSDTVDHAAGYAVGETGAITVDHQWTCPIGTAVYDSNGNVYHVKAIGTKNVTFEEALVAALADGATISECGLPKNAPIYPGEAGSGGRDVYSTLILGADAYGTTEVTGGGLEHFVKQLGSAGTADPLNQRSTVGWKATKAAIRLVEEYMLRIETCSTFESGAN